MTFLHEYGLFLLKTLTVVVAVVAVLAVTATVCSRAVRARGPSRRGLQVRNLNRTYEDLAWALRSRTMPAKAAKAQAKELRKARKALDAGSTRHAGAAPTGAAPTGAAPTSGADARPRVFVLDFHGDVRATEVAALREEITAIVTVARPGDEVVVRLENPGGLVADQGLAAAQLMRVRSRGLRLVVAVDKVAASGGYMMACVADRILAAPFAVVGSIGVIAEIPNVYRLLDRTGIEFEQFTGGEHKRTVTPFTRTTDANREKLTSQIEDTHALFKEFVGRHRPRLDIERVGTGEYWYGTRAVELGLVDELVTSDDHLLARVADADLYTVSWSPGRTPARKLAALVGSMTSVTRLDHPR
ncbi:MAG: protease SohB [Kineosporiaceae bacterium]